jgi:hypothetical protein
MKRSSRALDPEEVRPRNSDSSRAVHEGRGAMASIHKTSAGTYQVRWRSQGVLKAKNFTLKRDARAWADQVEVVNMKPVHQMGIDGPVVYCTCGWVDTLGDEDIIEGRYRCAEQSISWRRHRIDAEKNDSGFDLQPFGWVRDIVEPRRSWQPDLARRWFPSKKYGER